jgi:hypothetical protein
MEPVMRTLVGVAAALLAFASAALAQGYSRPEIVRGLCQKSGCDEFSVLSAERLRSRDGEALIRTRVRTYHASSRGRVAKGEDAGYVFCSPTRPTVLAEGSGTVTGFRIATAPAEESRETKRQQANFYAIYFTVCHGPDAGRAAVHNMEGVAQQHGYHSPLAKSETVTFASPEDVFSRPAQGNMWQAERTTPPERLPLDTRSGDLLPPRNVPDARERPMRDGRLTNRAGQQATERPPIAEETPWYVEPQKWFESLNPFQAAPPQGSRIP